MKKKLTFDKSTAPFIGMAVLAVFIAFLILVGIRGIQAAAGISLDNNDQRDLHFFVSLYYFVSILAFVIAAPLLVLFVVQVTQLLTGKK